MESLDIDRELLSRFEEGLDPVRIENSPVPARVLGYGEISAIFEIAGDRTRAYKRMPLFENRALAEAYEANYHTYCGHLARAGLRLPATATAVVEAQGRPAALYIVQESLPQEAFCHNRLHRLSASEALDLVDRVAGNLDLVWAFNQAHAPALALAVDGQISNWAFSGDGPGAPLLFLDTSTPLFRVNGRETLDPGLLLKATPFFLRWVARLFFLEEVMTRYYIPRRVMTDIAANLYKEQLPALVPDAVEVLNRHLPENDPRMTPREIERYYRMDKTIWKTFLGLRRLDRFLKTRVRRGRYEFILPGKIFR